MPENPFEELWHTRRDRGIPEWRKHTARHNVRQYNDLLDTVDAMRIKAGFTFDELAERLHMDATTLRQQLSMSYNSLTFSTLQLISQVCGIQFSITLAQTPEAIAPLVEQQRAGYDAPEAVVVARSMADIADAEPDSTPDSVSPVQDMLEP